MWKAKGIELGYYVTMPSPHTHTLQTFTHIQIPHKYIYNTLILHEYNTLTDYGKMQMIT